MYDMQQSIKEIEDNLHIYSISTKKKILIVDDNAVNRKILVKNLGEDYIISEAADGKEALAVLKVSGQPYSLILLDIVMPVMDGYEFLKERQKDAVLSSIPVIVTTQKDGEENEIKALSLGASDFISKPYNPQIIKHRISNILRLQENAGILNAKQKDELTGVYNKDFFYQTAEFILNGNRDKKFDIVCCDIERFKLINNLFGMKVGDNLLRYVSSIMAKDIGDCGICGRVGTDSFACLVPHREDYSSSLFEHTISTINQFPISISIHVSFGIYVIEDLTVPVSTMCDRALLACNSIKGKYDIHYASYDDSLMQSVLAEQSILDEIEIAFLEKQFEVYYQPKYDVFTEKIVGAEALVRWRHPKKGFISPGKFIPLFEKNGFITELDLYVWDTVCSNLHDWTVNGNKYVPVSVNVSRVDIYHPDLINIFLELIRKYELKPQYLHLEITETAYTENCNQLIEVVTKLKALGFIIEMDDFGSGYSSLNMLSELPLDVLKLDMKFIQNETAKNSSKSILSFVISLAKWMNLLVIAEGVETKAQLDLLRNMDCNYVQGYYYAKPMSRKDLEKHLFYNQVAEEEETPKITAIGTETVQITKSKSDKVMMIIDDVEVNRVILSEIFSEYYTLVEADNGKTAYEYILEHYESIDVILLDLVMPIMDGFQLLQKIKCSTKLADIPVIVTSQAGEDSEARALEMGAADFIAKPYNEKVALRRVNNVLATSTVIKLEKENAIYQRMREMELKAKTDALTGLYNRAEFEAQINPFFSEKTNQNATFIILDIDNFKLVNDRLGHARGDEALQRVAQILGSCFRDDDLTCRMGGDEFSAFIRGALSTKDLNARLQRLCEKLRFKIEDMSISCSIGACSSPFYGNDYQTLYKNADMALMSAKRLGKNQYHIFGGDTQLPSHVLLRNMDWLMDEASEAVMVCDAGDHHLLYLNNVACTIAGKSRKECMGQKCYKAIWDRTAPCVHCIESDQLSNQYHEYEVHPEGTDRSFIIKSKLVDWGGNPARIQYIQDNTNKAAIARKLSDISADRKRLLDLMPGGIFRYSADSETFDFVSKNMLKMLGYTQEQFDEKFQNKFWNMVWHEDRERVEQEITEQIMLGDTDECDYRIEKANGELCWVHNAGHLVRAEDGKAWFYATIAENIDRLKQLEKDAGL
ncbi:MAG: EAL domain-containing protein [Lachnospiraceae bacterium]|nr:EAL domain-containing protein [Lachnospiraceae bacterium]